MSSKMAAIETVNVVSSVLKDDYVEDGFESAEIFPIET